MQEFLLLKYIILRYFMNFLSKIFVIYHHINIYMLYRILKFREYSFNIIQIFHMD